MSRPAAIPDDGRLSLLQMRSEKKPAATGQEYERFPTELHPRAREEALFNTTRTHKETTAFPIQSRQHHSPPKFSSFRNCVSTARASPLWCYRLSSGLTACLSPAYHSYRS